ncbi:MAG: hypothetical protein CL677_05125 [Bdellovibrionaceae bacterium]|nr:hypothetical protein [Pseudobdellovibrionaceae bacterium]
MKSLGSKRNLKEALARLEDSALKIVNSRGYTDEVARLKCLAELIREQFKNENTSNSTRTVR